MARVLTDRSIITGSGAQRHATWLELFFDLVVVAAVATLGEQLHDDHSISGVLRFAGLLAVVWWVWISYSYFADLFDEDGPVDRVAQLAAMLGTAVLAVTLANGVGEGSRILALTCCALFVLLALLYATAARAEPEAAELCRWYAFGSGLGAVMWAVSAFVPVPGRWWMWGAAVVANAAVSGPIAYARMRSAPAQASHMPERFGLFTIVVLGEAVLAVVRGVDATEWATGPVVSAMAGFVVAACIWWVYFDAFDESAIDRAIEGGRRAQVRAFLYGYGHLLIFAAVVAAGAGVELGIAEAAQGDAAPALLGWASTAVIAGFVLISQGIGLSVHPVAIAAKALVVVTSVVVAVFSVPATAGAVAVAGAWLLLVLVEVRLSSATANPPGPIDERSTPRSPGT